MSCYSGDSAETTEEQAIREAVERRIDSLDDSFIGAVRAFEVAARSQSLDDVAGVCCPSTYGPRSSRSALEHRALYEENSCIVCLSGITPVLPV